MKTKYFYPIIIAILCVVSTSCDDDKEQPIPPTFKGFTYSPNPAKAGEKMKITAVIRDKGKNVYGPRYTWTLTLDTVNADGATVKDAKIKKEWKGSISDGNPSVEFILPKSICDPAYAKCTFYADYQNNADAITFPEFENSTDEEYLGRFNPSRVASVLYSNVSGSFTFAIEQ